MEATLHGMGYAVLNTLVIYVLLIAGVRTLGRRQAGQLTALDLLIVLLLGSAVETALIGPSQKTTTELFHDPNVTLPAGLASATTLLCANWTVDRLLRRSRRFRHWVCGGCLLLVHGGKPVSDNLRRAGMTEANLLQALRAHGFASARDAEYVVLEPNGETHVLSCDVHARRTGPLPSACPPS